MPIRLPSLLFITLVAWFSAMGRPAHIRESRISAWKAAAGAHQALRQLGNPPKQLSGWPARTATDTFPRDPLSSGILRGTFAIVSAHSVAATTTAATLVRGHVRALAFLPDANPPPRRA